MRILRDVPGERLVLEADPPRSFPLLIWAFGAGLALLLLFGPLRLVFDVVQRGEMDAGGVAGVVIGGALTAFIVASFLPRIRYTVFRIDFDRTAGVIRLGERRSVGGGRRERTLPLDRLQSATLRTLAANPGRTSFQIDDPGTGRMLHLVLTFARDESGTPGDSRDFVLRVEHLDQAAEVMDFAYRVGASAGLGFAHVLRNDPRAVEVELRRTREPGFAPAPFDLAPADYARDAVAPAAREAVARETLPAFEAASFPSDHRVIVYEPRRRVVLRKPLGFAAIGCLPFTLLLLAGPAAFVTFGYVPNMGLAPRLIASLFALVLGLLFGSLAALSVKGALPRTVTLDWETGRATATGSGKFDVALSDVRAVELRQVHRVHRSKNSTTHRYYCAILLSRRSATAARMQAEEPDALPLAETTHLKDDPDTPYQAALPLATELAKALGVERRITED